MIDNELENKKIIR